MTVSFLESARAKFKTLAGVNLDADIDVGFSTLAKEIDTKVMSYSQGSTGSKPAAGQPNRLWRDTTTSALYYDTGTEWLRVMIGEAVTAKTITGPYSARANITEGVEQTPSATRPTMVCLTIVPTEGGSGKGVNVSSNGSIIAQTGDAVAIKHAFTFILPPGGKWSWSKISGAATVKASYLTL